MSLYSAGFLFVHLGGMVLMLSSALAGRRNLVEASSVVGSRKSITDPSLTIGRLDTVDVESLTKSIPQMIPHQSIAI